MRVVGTLILVMGVSIAWLLGVQGFSVQQALDHVTQLLRLASGGGTASGSRSGGGSSASG